MPVTDADVAHVRRAFEEFNVRFEALRRGGLDDYFAEFYAPEGEIFNVDGFPLPARYSGIEGYRRWFDETYGPYAAVRWTVRDAHAVGERVVALVTARGRPLDDPTELEVNVALTYEMERGRIRRVRNYVHDEDALAAAELGE